MDSRPDPIADIDVILQPKLFQVIGSTPESLREACEKCDLKGKANVAAKFVSLCIFSASVNKPTVESFFAEESMREVRSTCAVGFVLNGKVNMTALTLAGHCFMLEEKIQKLEYVKAFSRKLGQMTIWDGSLDGGSISDKQKQILKEKQKVHDKEACKKFATWFLSWTGMLMAAPRRREDLPLDTPIRRRAGRSESIDLGGVPTRSASATRESAERAASKERDRVAALRSAQEDVPPEVTATLPADVVEYYFNTIKKSQEDLESLVAEHGVERVIKNIRRAMGGSSGSIVGT